MKEETEAIAVVSETIDTGFTELAAALVGRGKGLIDAEPLAAPLNRIASALERIATALEAAK